MEPTLTRREIVFLNSLKLEADTARRALVNLHRLEEALDKLDLMVGREKEFVRLRKRLELFGEDYENARKKIEG